MQFLVLYTGCEETYAFLFSLQMKAKLSFDVLAE